MKQYLNILLSLFLTITSCQPTFAQTKVDGSLLKGDVIGGTASNTRRLVLPKDTKANLDAKTRIEGNVVWGSDTKKAYVDNGTALSLIGSGSGGDRNYIDNGDAEGASSSILVPYIGSGTRPAGPGSGSPSDFATTLNSTTPIDLTKDFTCTKSGSVNSQGRGCKIPFSINANYPVQKWKIQFNYRIASGTFTAGTSTTDSDMIVYIWDSTASKAVEPENFKLMSNSDGTFSADFQPDKGSTSFILMFHQATTSTNNYSIQIDNIKVAPSTYIYGTVDTEWTTYTPTFAGLGTVVLAEAFWKRVGDSVIIKGRATTGTTTASTVTISLPAGMVISSTKNTIQAIYGHLVNNSTPGNFDLLAAPGGTTVGVGNIGGSSGLSTAVGTTVAGNGQVFSWYSQPIPIAGWAANTQVSDGYEGRDISFKALFAGLTGINPNNSVVKLLVPTPTKDTVGGWEPANNGWRIKTAGAYNFDASISFLNTNVQAAYHQLFIFKNGVEIGHGGQYATLTNNYFGLQATAMNIDCVAGDIIDLRFYGSANYSVSTLSQNANGHFSGSKIQAPATISAQEKMYLFYRNSSGQSIANATQTTLTNWTKVSDSHNSFNGTTGIFTAPFAGTFEISSMITFGDTVSAGDRNVYIRDITGSVDIVHNIRPYTSAASGQISQNISATVDLVAGQQIAIQVTQGSGSSQNVVGVAVRNTLSIKQVK